MQLSGFQLSKTIPRFRLTELSSAKRQPPIAYRKAFEGAPVTTRSRSPLICVCGHRGYLLCSENDQPFSSLWEEYSLEGFKGESLTVTNFRDRPKDLLSATNLSGVRTSRQGELCLGQWVSLDFWRF